jgi:hypothetical protein
VSFSSSSLATRMALSGHIGWVCDLLTEMLEREIADGNNSTADVTSPGSQTDGRPKQQSGATPPSQIASTVARARPALLGARCASLSASLMIFLRSRTNAVPANVR